MIRTTKAAGAMARSLARVTGKDVDAMAKRLSLATEINELMRRRGITNSQLSFNTCIPEEDIDQLVSGEKDFDEDTLNTIYSFLVDEQQTKWNIKQIVAML